MIRHRLPGSGGVRDPNRPLAADTFPCRSAAARVHPGRVSQDRISRDETAAMVRRAVLTCLILSVALAVAAALIPGIDVTGGFVSYLWLGLLFGVVNAILGPILHLLSLPLTILTLGLFALVVNGVLLATTAGLSDKLDVGGFLGTIVGALVISVVTAVLGFGLRLFDREPV